MRAQRAPAYKYRLMPTNRQRAKLQATLELCRWVYNQSLAMRKDAWEQEQRNVSYYDTKKMLPIWKATKPELGQVYSQALQNVTERVELAFQAYFRRVKAGALRQAQGAAGELVEPGYPRFKGYGNYDSFTFTQTGFKLTGDKLTLSKIGDIAIKLHRPICAPQRLCAAQSATAKVKTLTIQRDALGNFYACFSCDYEVAHLEPTHKSIGIDLGLTTFAYFSNGRKIKRQRWMKKDAADIARLQRKKEKLVKGSIERKKVIRALNHAYQRSTNRRRDFAHQASRKLVNEYQFIAFEALDIKEMQSSDDKRYTRGMADVAWGQFVQFTTYKAANAGRVVALVNPRGTTQMCSAPSGHPHAVVPKGIEVRVHDCPHCGLKLHRDHNAALNILARGLASINPASAGIVEAQAL